MKSPIYLLDGGLGTTLADNHRCVFNNSTPLWSSHLLLTSPSTLLSAQTSFAAAGADILLTATYQASFAGFAASGVNEHDAVALMRSAVRIARLAFKHREAGLEKEKGNGKVALSLGAYGATMVPSTEYSGVYDSDHVTRGQLGEWHRRRLEVFLDLPDTKMEEGVEVKNRCWTNVDFVAFETLPRIEEVSAVRDAMNFFEGRRAEAVLDQLRISRGWNETARWKQCD